MNQRAGKTHAAGMRDEGGGSYTLKQIIELIAACKTAMAGSDEFDAEIRFEILEDWLRHDVANGTPLTFTNKTLGL